MAVLQEDCWVFREAAVSLRSMLCVKQNQALHFSDIFCPASGGTELWMLTRKLNLNSPSSLIGAGTQIYLFLYFICFMVLQLCYSVQCVLGFWDTLPLLLIIWPIEQLYEFEFWILLCIIISSTPYVWPKNKLGLRSLVAPWLVPELAPECYYTHGYVSNLDWQKPNRGFGRAELKWIRSTHIPMYCIHF